MNTKWKTTLYHSCCGNNNLGKLGHGNSSDSQEERYVTYMWRFTAVRCVLSMLQYWKRDVTSTLFCLLLQVRRPTKRRRHTTSEVKTNLPIWTSATRPHCRQRHLVVRCRRACCRERTRWRQCLGPQTYRQTRRSSSTLQVSAPLLVSLVQVDESFVCSGWQLL